MLKFKLIILMIFGFAVTTADEQMQDDVFYNDFPFLTNSSTPRPPTLSTNDMAFKFIYIILTILGLLANGVVFFVIFCGGEITKTVTTIYVAQLAIADSIFLIIVPYFVFAHMDHNYSGGVEWCKTYQTVKYLNYYSGIFFLTAMSVDRYIAVAYSTRAQQIRTSQRTLVICVFVWLVSIIATLPITVYSEIENVQGNPICRVIFPGYKRIPPQRFDFYINEPKSNLTAINDSIAYDYESNFFEIESNYNTINVTANSHDDVISKCDWKNESISYFVYHIFQTLAGYIFPLSVISISYFLIIKKLTKSSENLGTSGSSRSSSSTKQRVTRTVMCLVICFTLCWMPYHIVMTMRIPGFDFEECSLLEQAVTIIGYSNSVFNPLLYTFLGYNFRKRLSDSWKKTRNRVQSGNRAFNTAQRKSKPCTSKRSGGTPFSKIKQPEIEKMEIVANEAELSTDLTGNQPAREGTKTTLLEMQTIKQNPESLWKSEDEQNEKTECLSRA